MSETKGPEGKKNEQPLDSEVAGRILNEHFAGVSPEEFQVRASAASHGNIPPLSPPTGLVRRELPDERQAITHKFSVAGHEGYVTVDLYEDGTPGEVFLTMAKESSTISGLMDAFAASISLSFQYGVPVDVLVGKFINVRFELAGYTRNPEIPVAKSFVDYVARWLGLRFLTLEQKEKLGLVVHEPLGDPTTPRDMPTCYNCGSSVVRREDADGYLCRNCLTKTDIS